MEETKKTKINSIIEYVIISICIFCSGAVAYTSNHRMILIVAIIFMLLLIFFKKNIKSIKAPYYIVLFIILYIATSIYHCMSSGINFFGEMGIFAQFVFSILICILINPKTFIDKYNKIICFLGITSIIMYIIPFIFPNFTSFFPVVQDYAGSKFYNAGLYCYPIYIVKHYYRNQSIFWESGAFQAFLNIALFLELYVKKDKNKKYILIYIITILTTQSTTGYIILILLVITKIIQKVSVNIKYLKTVLLLSVCIIPLIPIFSSVIIQKFSPDSANYSSFLRRYYDTVVDFKIVFENIGNFLLGVGEENYMQKFSQILNTIGIGTFSETSSSSNSLTAFVAQHGIISAIPICILYIKGIFSIKKIPTKIIFLLTILICLTTENFVMAPTFLVLMLQMDNYLKDDKEEIYE